MNPVTSRPPLTEDAAHFSNHLSIVERSVLYSLLFHREKYIDFSLEIFVHWDVNIGCVEI